MVNTRPELLVVNETIDKLIPNGEYVDEFGAISYKCLSRYILDGKKKNYCLGGNWIVPHPNCIRKFFPPYLNSYRLIKFKFKLNFLGYCSNKVIQGTTFKANCKHKGIQVSCNDYIKSGTIVQISCANGYRKPNRSVQEYLRCDEFGEWDYTPFRCEPECGTISTHNNNNNKTEIINIPWHALIYSKLSGQFKQICSGTIINAKLILSAASCFWNIKEERPYNPLLFNVIVGKYYFDDSTKESLPTQIFNITEISIPSG